MGTTVQKLQRILETKTGFKNLITEKGGIITETTTFHEYIDEARKLIEGGKVVVEESEKLAVTNVDNITDKVLLDTTLSIEEVDKIITDANLTFLGAGSPSYSVISFLPEGFTWETSYRIGKYSDGYVIYSHYDGDESYLYCSSKEFETELGFYGWSPMFSELEQQMPDAYVNGQMNILYGYTLKSASVRDQNEALKDLFYIPKTSKQPVPNSGYVESIKFNTSLSPEEVDKIITDANLDFVNMSNSSVSSYVVVLEDTQNNIMIANIGPAIGVDNAYIIQLLSTDLEDYDTYVYISPAAAEASGAPISGWGIDSDFVFNMMTEVVSEYEYDDGKVAPVGLQNDKLVDLFYIGTEPFRKELTGTYEAVTVDVTENSEVDLTTYMDEQKMPIKVNVNIEAGASGEAIEVATEEELDAAMVEENIGKFYKYTGETTVKYEKDAVYVVQDADNPIIEDEIKSITTEVEMDAVLVEENIGKFFLYAGETCDKYINNMIYTVQDSDNPIIDSPAIIEGGATGTAVPNEGHVDKIYFNTNLTSEEVDKIITDANLPWIDANGMQLYFAISMADRSGLSIVKASMFDPSLEGHYSFLSVFNDNTTSMQCYLSTATYPFADIIIGAEPEEAGYDESGWCTHNGQWNGESFPQAEFIDNLNGYPSGTHNEALKQIFSITPFDGEPFHKELKGTYEPVTVEVTENSEINLTTYMDNGEMPIKINVNVEESGDSGVPLQPATEEEMNNLLVNENIGKVFLYTGETNENFTNGEYYIIEEVTE